MKLSDRSGCPKCLRSISDFFFWECVFKVVVILSSSRKDKYDSIKKYLCVDCPVPSQCVVSRTLNRTQALMTVATKIILQIACKMGGELWSVEIPVCHSTHQFVQKIWTNE